jgi:cytochrome P450
MGPLGGTYPSKFMFFSNSEISHRIHSRYRESLSHHFHFDVIKHWIPFFNELDDVFLTEMSKHLGQKFDIVPLLTRLTIDALGKIIKIVKIVKKK